MDFNNILEFSRQNCLGICAFLVPANILITSQTLILAFLGKTPRYLGISVTLGVFVALLQISHVASWFVIGVVTPITFILISLSSLCLCLNLWIFFNPVIYRSGMKAVIQFSKVMRFQTIQQFNRLSQ